MKYWLIQNQRHLLTSIVCLLLSAHLIIDAKVAYAKNADEPISPVSSAKMVTTVKKEVPKCKVADTFTKEVKYWEADICRWSEEHEMDPDLIATIMQIESCGDDQAVSATGVRGLFQVTGANLDGENPFNPNVSMAKGPGKVLLSELKAADNNVRAAMAGYNGGAWARQYVAGDIDRGQFVQKLRSHRLWRTTSKALTKVNEVERYAQWANIYYEAKEGKADTLKIWQDLGGQHLCDRASVQLGLSQPQPKHVVSSEVKVNK
jgi:hypothetical protein